MKETAVVVSTEPHPRWNRTVRPGDFFSVLLTVVAFLVILVVSFKKIFFW